MQRDRLAHQTRNKRTGELAVALDDDDARTPLTAYDCEVERVTTLMLIAAEADWKYSVHLYGDSGKHAERHMMLIGDSGGYGFDIPLGVFYDPERVVVALRHELNEHGWTIPPHFNFHLFDATLVAKTIPVFPFKVLQRL